MDNIDTCLVCNKEIPPGPDFCGPECEGRFNAEKDISGFIAWVEFCRWLREDFPTFCQAQALRSVDSKSSVFTSAKYDDKHDGAGAHWR